MSKRKNTTDSLAGAIGQVIPLLLNLVFTSIFIRSLGSEVFGFYNETIILISYLTILDFAMIFPIMRNTGSLVHKGDKFALKSELSYALGIYLLIGVIGGVILWIGSGFFTEKVFDINPDYTDQVSLIFKITGINFLGQLLINWGKNVLNSLGRVVVSNIFFIAYPILWITVSVVILLFEFDWINIFWFKAVFALVVGFTQVLVVSASVGGALIPKLGFKEAGLKKADLSKGFSLRLTDHVFLRYDQFLIGVVIGAKALGLYSLAFMIPNAILMVFYKMNEFVVHRATKIAHDNDQNGKAEFFEIGSSIFSFFSLAAAFSLAGLGKPFLELWVGKELASEAIQYLKILAMGFGLTGLFAPFGIPFLLGINRYDLVARYKWSKSLGLLIFVSIGLYAQGVFGAAIGVLASGIVELIFFLYCQGVLERRKLKMVLFRWALTLFFGTLFYFGIDRILQFLFNENPINQLFFGVLMGLLFWGVVGLFTPIIHSEARKSVFSIIR